MNEIKQTIKRLAMEAMKLTAPDRLELMTMIGVATCAEIRAPLMGFAEWFDIDGRETRGAIMVGHGVVPAEMVVTCIKTVTACFQEQNPASVLGKLEGDSIDMLPEHAAAINARIDNELGNS